MTLLRSLRLSGGVVSAFILSMLFLGMLLVWAPARAESAAPGADPTVQNAQRMIDEGRRTFRDDTFGSEGFWGGTLRLHQAIAGAKNGGVGGGVSPKTALAVGLKVDAERLPAPLVAQIKAGKVNLDDPATTVALLQLDSVVGVKGTFDAQGKLVGMGIRCSLCHSTVDDSFAPGIGRRRDGWANRDLNVGAIVSLSPGLGSVAGVLGVDEPTLKKVLAGWGPGKFDAEVFMDGKALRPDGTTGATLIPSAFGLAGVNGGTYTGWGSTTYWNAFVANLEMHGHGRFVDARLNDAKRFPLAAKGKAYDVKAGEDRVTGKLAALHLYQLALPVPVPPAGSFDAGAAQRGAALFTGQARCSTCHVPPLYTEPGWNMHTPEEIGIDDFQASRAPDRRYRTTPLRALFTKAKGGYYHDGRFADLGKVVDHYDATFSLKLGADQKRDLVELLKSL